MLLPPCSTFGEPGLFFVIPSPDNGNLHIGWLAFFFWSPGLEMSIAFVAKKKKFFYGMIAIDGR